MNELIKGFLDNDSFFGRFMTKLGIIIVANIMFMIFSLPFFTVGAGLVALYHVMLRTLRRGGVVNPFKEFWLGFKSNFKQATLLWLLAAAFAFCIWYEIKICENAGGVIGLFRYGLYAIGIIAVILFLFVLPVMAAFADTIPHLLRNAFFFAAKNPLRLIVILFFDIFPLYLTYSDRDLLPFYGFIWVSCGFGLLAMLGSTLLLPDFKPYLDKDHDFEGGTREDTQSLDDLEKMDGL